MRKSKVIITFLMVILSFGLIGCAPVNDALVKMGFKNNDFEFMKNNKVNQIVIQNTRDIGFRFIVTDPKVIEDIYKILSDGNPETEKSTLEPDYIFEIQTGDTVRKYDYVVGDPESGKGNFYDKDKAYRVPKDLDQTILNNLSFIKKPRDFYNIYYGSILKVVEGVKGQLDGQKIGVDILGDIDCVKYLFSVDLGDFQKQLKKVVPSAEVLNSKSNKSDYDAIISVQNRGYNSDTFKTIITVDDKKKNIYEKYYVLGKYEFKNWDIKVGDVNEKPEGW